MKKRLAYIIFLLFIAIIISLGLFEVLLRAQVIDLSFRGGNHAYIIDRNFLFRSKPGSTEEIDERGFRLNGRERDSSAKRTILFSGDSFAFGTNISADKTMAAHLEDMMGADYRVINLGVPGFGPDQAMMLFDEVAGDFNPETVVLSVFPANDFQDVYRNALFALSETGDVIKNEENLLKLHMPGFQTLLALDLLAYSMLNRRPKYDALFRGFFDDEFDFKMVKDIDSKESKKKVALMRGVLREYKKKVEARGARFIVVVIPSFELIVSYGDYLNGRPYDREKFALEEALLRICDEEGISVVNPYPPFITSNVRTLLYDEESHHLSGIGYQTVSDMIYRRLLE